MYKVCVVTRQGVALGLVLLRVFDMSVCYYGVYKVCVVTRQGVALRLVLLCVCVSIVCVVTRQGVALGLVLLCVCVSIVCIKCVLLPGRAWHSDWFWSHWQLGLSEQPLQLASLLHTCSVRTGHLVKFCTPCGAERHKVFTRV